MIMMLSRILPGDSYRLVSKGFLRLLAGLGGCLLAGGLMGWPGDSHAQANLPAMRQKLVPGNVQQCRDLLQRRPQLDPYAPKDASAHDKYCTCVGQGYVANMLDKVVLAFASGKLPEAPNQQAMRLRAAAASLDTARARCAAAQK
jgi:hypothetical protein